MAPGARRVPRDHHQHHRRVLPVAALRVPARSGRGPRLRAGRRDRDPAPGERRARSRAAHRPVAGPDRRRRRAAVRGAGRVPAPPRTGRAARPAPGGVRCHQPLPAWQHAARGRCLPASPRHPARRAPEPAGRRRLVRAERARHAGLHPAEPRHQAAGRRNADAARAPERRAGSAVRSRADREDGAAAAAGADEGRVQVGRRLRGPQAAGAGARPTGAGGVRRRSAAISTW